jgi:hypothetical protein
MARDIIYELGLIDRRPGPSGEFITDRGRLEERSDRS